MAEREYEIWSEGWRTNGDSGGAYLHARATGEDFPAACRNLAAKDPGFAAYFNAERLTYWGCRLFDNEFDARRAFG